jgi:hypothetical protein
MQMWPPALTAILLKPVHVHEYGLRRGGDAHPQKNQRVRQVGVGLGEDTIEAFRQSAHSSADINGHHCNVINRDTCI